MVVGSGPIQRLVVFGTARYQICPYCGTSRVEERWKSKNVTLCAIDGRNRRAEPILSHFTSSSALPSRFSSPRRRCVPLPPHRRRVLLPLPPCSSSGAATSIWALAPKRDRLRRAGLSPLFSRIRGPPPPGRQLHRHRRFLDVNSTAAGNDRTLHLPLLIFSLLILPIPVRCVLVPNGISIDRYNLLDRKDAKKN